MESLPPDANNVAPGQIKPASTWGEFNNVMFAVQQALSKLQTAMPVQIISCTNAGDLSPVGFVDVLPLVNQLNAEGIPTPHVTLFNIPYLRIQGGGNAIIMDPQQGDIGICIFASRDISKIKATKKQGNPGSRRQYSFSDGMYLGGLLNGTPTQFVQFNEAGITVTTPGTLTVNAATVVNVNAPQINFN